LNKTSKNPIRKVFLILSRRDHDPIQRPIGNPETFTALLNGISSDCQHVVVKTGLVMMRPRSCWCIACLASNMKGGFSSWLANHNTNGCSSATKNKSQFEFTKKSCSELSRNECQVAARTMQATRMERAKTISPGDWLLFDGRDKDEPIWLGRVMENTEWTNSCMWTNTGRRTTLLNGLRVDKGDVAINVQWCDTIEAGDSNLMCHVSREHALPIVNAHKFLILAGFEMIQVDGSAARRMQRARTTTSSLGECSVPRLNLQENENMWCWAWQ
jgi:hypothetical protein